MNSLDQSLSFPQYYAISNIASRQMSGLLFASFCFATIWAPPGGGAGGGETITVYLSQNKAFTFMLSDAKPHQLYFLINRVSQKNVWKYIHNILYIIHVWVSSVNNCPSIYTLKQLPHSARTLLHWTGVCFQLCENFLFHFSFLFFFSIDYENHDLYCT